MSLFQAASQRASYRESKFNQFQEEQKKVEKIQETEDKILFWKKCQKEAKQTGWLSRLKGLNKKYLKDVEAEIEYLEEVIKYGGNSGGDKRKKFTAEMYATAQNYISSHKDTFLTEFRGDKKPFVEKRVIPHLKEKFPAAEKYPAESTLRLKKELWPD